MVKKKVGFVCELVRLHTPNLSQPLCFTKLGRRRRWGGHSGHIVSGGRYVEPSVEAFVFALPGYLDGRPQEGQ